MKIAIISDIHGNLEALKSTFNDIKKRKVDKIFCLGDIAAKGMHPSECIKLIKENCEVVIQGNCDKHFAEEHKIDELSILEQKRLEYNNSLLTNDDKKYLGSLPYSYEFYISGSFVRIFHAHPAVINGLVLNISSVQDKYEMFKSSKNTMTNKVADIAIYGHIHHQFMDKLYNKTLINVGSVGNSFDTIRNDNKDSNVLETINSHYVIIEGRYESTDYGDDISINFVRVPYNIDKELENIELNIEKEDYLFELKEGKYRDLKKIENDFIKRNIEV